MSSAGSRLYLKAIAQVSEYLERLLICECCLPYILAQLTSPTTILVTVKAIKSLNRSDNKLFKLLQTKKPFLCFQNCNDHVSTNSSLEIFELNRLQKTSEILSTCALQKMDVKGNLQTKFTLFYRTYNLILIMAKEFTLALLCVSVSVYLIHRRLLLDNIHISIQSERKVLFQFTTFASTH